MALTDTQARQALADPSAAPGLSEMVGIACGLDRNGPPLAGGLSPQVAADVLMVWHRKTWRRSMDRGQLAQFPYQPAGGDAATMASSQSRVSVALADADEGPLRAFAVAAAPPLVRVRCLDILWERFHRPDDAAAAIDESCRYIGFATAEEWTTAEDAVGRAAVLVALRKDSGRVPALLDAFDRLGALVLGGKFYFAFAPIMETFVATVLRSKFFRPLVATDYRARWALTLEWIAENLFGIDAYYGQTCYSALAEAFGASGLPNEAERVRRRLVAHLLACASAQGGIAGSSHASAALDTALTHGFRDLVEESKRVLHDRVRATSAEMKAMTFPLALPAAVVGEIDNTVDSAPSAASAVRTLGGLIGLCDFAVDATESAAKSQLEESVFAALIPSEHYRDGKVIFRGRDPASKLREAVARNFGVHLALVEHLVGRALGRLTDRLSPVAMAEAVGAWPWLPHKRQVWLHRASERFHAGDFMSAGLILATQYEGILRDLLRADGLSALKTNAEGVLMDETLGSLLQQKGLRDALGEDHLRFVEFLMCDPEFGPNLRNEVAHGNAPPWELTAPRVFLMWLLIVRLTFFAPTTEAAAPP